MKPRDFWINQAFFQASWPACVIGASHGLIWPGLLVVGGFVLWQLAPARRHAHDVATIARFLLAGLVLDTLWLRLGIVEYASPVPLAGFAPLWLLLLWLALGLTVNHSLAMFRRRWRLLLLLAAIGSPMSYAAAAGFGAVTWTAPVWLVLICLGPVWALVVGLLFRVSRSTAGRMEPEPRQKRAWIS